MWHVSAVQEMTVGQRVRWARRRANLSQDRLALHIGTTRQVVIGWEKDRHRPGAQSRRKLAEATGQRADFFRDEDDDDEEADTLERELLTVLRAYVAVHARRERKRA